MQTHELQQGTIKWAQFRMEHLPASEAAAALGISPKMKRNELLHVRHTGNPKEYSSYLENVIFKQGHELEDKAREILEQNLRKEFYPVTCSKGKYSASCDGLTLDETIAFEHKQWNRELVNYMLMHNSVPDEYKPQCQQILAVTGAEVLIFVCSDGTRDNWKEIRIYPDAEYWQKIAEAWDQLKKTSRNISQQMLNRKRLQQQSKNCRL